MQYICRRVTTSNNKCVQYKHDDMELPIQQQCKLLDTDLSTVCHEGGTHLMSLTSALVSFKIIDCVGKSGLTTKQTPKLCDVVEN